MSAAWQRPVARVYGAGERVVGAGALAVGGVVLTCAHVVIDALAGTGIEPAPGAKVWMDFPFAGVEKIEAAVAERGWHPVLPELQRRVDGPLSDLAVLRPCRPEELAGVDLCVLPGTDPAPGTDFSSMGFPFGFPAGALTEGTLRHLDGGGRLDAKAADGFGHFVDPGFSGAPVFERCGVKVSGGICLGLCVTSDADGKRIARIIPPEQLVRALREVVSPYRWLAAFQTQDAPFFFGRSGLVTELWEELRRNRFLLMVGDAGSGKSSLLRAGLGSRAQAEGRVALTMRPLGAPLAEFCRVLGLPAGSKHSHDAILCAIEAKPLLLGIDQAEEVLRGDDPATASDFFQLLSDLRERSGDNLLIALAARSDALPKLLNAQPRSRLLERHIRHIGEMSREELRAAITQPASRLRMHFQGDLAERIVNDVLVHKVPLPVLQLCLSKLWAERDGNVIPARAYNDLGGVIGALASHASDVMADLQNQVARILKDGTPLPRSVDLGNASEALNVARKLLLHLVEVGARPGEDRRRAVPRDRLHMVESGLHSLFAPSKADVAAQKVLEDSRLVVAVRLPDGTEALELAHDSLLKEWTELGEWLERTRAFRRWHDRLLARARQAPDDLLSEAALAEAERMASEGVAHYEVLKLIAESRKRIDTEADRLRAERDAALRMGSLFLAERARKATAEDDPMTGMLLALEALPNEREDRRRPVVAEAEFALHEAWARNRERLCLSLGNPINRVAFSPNSEYLYTLSHDRSTRIWNAGTGEQLPFEVRGHADFVSLGCDGVHFVMSYRGTTEFWSPVSGTSRASFSFKHSFSKVLAASPDGKRLLIKESWNTLYAWASVFDIDTGTKIAQLKSGPIDVASFSPSGEKIVTAGNGAMACVWDVATGSIEASCEVNDWRILAVTYSSNQALVAVVDEHHIIRVWDVEAGTVLVTCEGHSNRILHAAFSPDGVHLLTASKDSTVRIWNLLTPSASRICEGHRGPVEHADFSPDGARFVTSGNDGTARIWSSATGQLLAVLGKHQARVLHATFSPNGAVVATASEDGTARIWDASVSPLHTFVVHCSEPAVRACFSPDGAWFVTVGEYGTIDIFRFLAQANACFWEGSLRTGTHPGRLLHIAFNPEGVGIATAGEDGTVRIRKVLWLGMPFTDPNTLPLVPKGHSGHVLSAAFARSGAQLVTAGQDGTVCVWNALTGAQIGRYTVGDKPVLGAAFSPDGVRLVTVCEDRAARVWDAASGSLLAVCEGHEGPVRHAAFSPDGARLATVDAHGRVTLWRYFRNTAELVALAWRQRSRELTELQRKNSHLPPLANGQSDPLSGTPPLDRTTS